MKRLSHHYLNERCKHVDLTEGKISVKNEAFKLAFISLDTQIRTEV